MALMFDTHVQKMKYDVLRGVARLAYEDALTPQNLMDLPNVIIPEGKPHFRCCIYKERAIISERIAMALGGHPEKKAMVEVDRIFTVSVLLPDRPGMLVRVAQVVAERNGNVIKLEHNQFVSTNRNAAVELRLTIEAYGTDHKREIVGALESAGFSPTLVQTSL